MQQHTFQHAGPLLFSHAGPCSSTYSIRIRDVAVHSVCRRGKGAQCRRSLSLQSKSRFPMTAFLGSAEHLGRRSLKPTSRLRGLAPSPHTHKGIKKRTLNRNDPVGFQSSPSLQTINVLDIDHSPCIQARRLRISSAGQPLDSLFDYSEHVRSRDALAC